MSLQAVVEHHHRLAHLRPVAQMGDKGRLAHHQFRCNTDMCLAKFPDVVERALYLALDSEHYVDAVMTELVRSKLDHISLHLG